MSQRILLEDKIDIFFSLLWNKLWIIQCTYLKSNFVIIFPIKICKKKLTSSRKIDENVPYCLTKTAYSFGKFDHSSIIFFEKSSWKNQVQRTGFLASKNQFRNWFLQATSAVKIKLKLISAGYTSSKNQVEIN